MVCSECEKKPVITLISGRKLCRSDFIKYFEKKVFKTIGKYKLIQNKDRIAVGISGGKDSLTVLYLIKKLNSKIKNIDIFAILIDEGINGYRNKTIKDAKKFCKEHKIKLYIYSYKKELGKSLDELIKTTDMIPCAMCGVFRRYLLNKHTRLLKATKLATGHNLDDEAQAVLMNQFRNNVALNARMGPITGVVKDKKFIPRIKPLYFMYEKEVMLYAYLKGFTTNDFVECPNARFSFRGEIRDYLNEFEKKHPGTKYGIINSFIETLPLLKQKYKESGKKIKECKDCGEPSSQEICKTCQLIEKLIKKPSKKK
jgi:tRNA-5-methyluridine54 2-sulfurtransferase